MPNVEKILEIIQTLFCLYAEITKEYIVGISTPTFLIANGNISIVGNISEEDLKDDFI